MIARILVGLGGTPFTPTAIRYARISPHPPEVARELLTDVADYCRADGYEAEVEHVESSAQQLLLQHATDWKADAIIVGNSVKHFWLKKLLGETAMHIIRHANVPLFLSQ